MKFNFYRILFISLIFLPNFIYSQTDSISLKTGKNLVVDITAATHNERKITFTLINIVGKPKVVFKDEQLPKSFGGKLTEPDLPEGGKWEYTFIPTVPGKYQLEAIAWDNRKQEARAIINLTVSHPALLKPQNLCSGEDWNHNFIVDGLDNASEYKIIYVRDGVASAPEFSTKLQIKGSSFTDNDIGKELLVRVYYREKPFTYLIGKEIDSTIAGTQDPNRPEGQTPVEEQKRVVVVEDPTKEYSSDSIPVKISEKTARVFIPRATVDYDKQITFYAVYCCNCTGNPPIIDKKDLEVKVYRCNINDNARNPIGPEIAIKEIESLGSAGDYAVLLDDPGLDYLDNLDPEAFLKDADLQKVRDNKPAEFDYVSVVVTIKVKSRNEAPAKENIILRLPK